MLSIFGFMRTWSDKRNKYLDPKIWNYQPVRKMLLELPALPHRSFATYYFWNKKERKINFFHDLILIKWFFSSIQFSRSVVSDSLWSHELQHARPPCPSRTPGVYSDSCPSNWWCHPAISSSVIPFSSCPQCLSNTYQELVASLVAQMVKNHMLVTVISPKNIEVSNNNNNKNCLYEIYFDWETIKRKLKKNSK